MTPTPAEQRRLFDEWFHSPGHTAYMAAVAAGGGKPLDDPEQAFVLYRRRWAQPAVPAGLTTPTSKERTA